MSGYRATMPENGLPPEGRPGQRWKGYYLTAYGIAVKHGFTGTEEEWLESLRGKTVQLRYNEETETLQWAYEGSDEWTDVLDINDLRSEIVSQTLEEAEAARTGAEAAQGKAEELAGQAADSAGAAAGSADDARDSADAAAKSEQSARDSADAAAKSEQSARDYAGKPPKVEGGTWRVWDALGQSYTDTGVKAYTTPRGAYDPETAYTLLDVVGYGGASFLALQDVQGVAPSDDGIHWMALAEKGDQGASFTRLEKTAGTGAPGTTDTYTAYNSEDQAAGTIQVYNGMDGLGTGDFRADGTVPMTGNLQMGQHRVTGVADATEDDDAVNKGQMDAALESVTVTTDATPTEGSANPVQSGGVYTALAGKADLTLSNLSNYQKALRNIGGRPGRNLLHNWYFPQAVNQRGETSWSGKGYHLDRWYEELDAVGSLGTDGYHIGTGKTVVQRHTEAEMKQLLGKTITISCLLSDGSFATATGTLPDELTETFSIICYPKSGFAFMMSLFYSAKSYQFGRISNGSGSEITVVACKTELGPTQTLAYQDEEGNWQLFETPDYGEELAKCQRYLLVLNQAHTTWCNYGVGDAYTSERAFILVPIPVTMRTNPVLSMGANITLRNGSTYPTISSAYFYRMLENAVCLDIRSTALTQGAPYSLVGNTSTTDNSIVLSAEL